MSAHPSPLLAALFPADVCAAEQRQPGDPALLYPEEAAHLRQAIARGGAARVVLPYASACNAVLEVEPA